MSGCNEHSAPEPVFAEPWHAQVFAVVMGDQKIQVTLLLQNIHRTLIDF